MQACSTKIEAVHEEVEKHQGKIDAVGLMMSHDEP